MPKKPEDYRKSAREDAADAVENFLDEIAEQLVENGKASDDMNNDYPDGDAYHHENHVDKSYDLLEAAHLLEQLYLYEEDDSGLWEGMAPKDAISTMAAYTYGNAVYDFWKDLIKEINEEVEAEGKWGPTGPKEWSPRGGMPLSWAQRIVRQVLKNWRKS